MTTVSNSTPVLDENGDPAVERIVRVYRVDTGALLSKSKTHNGSTPLAESTGWARTTDSTGWGSYTLRVAVDGSLLSPGDHVKVTFRAATGFQSVIGAAYVGIKASSGDVYDFESTPVQLLFGGSGTATVTAGAELQSDAAALAVGLGKSIIVAVYFSAASSVDSKPNVPGWKGDYKSGNDASTVNATGYTSSGTVWSVCGIETSVDPLAAGMYEIDCGSYSDPVNVVLLDGDASPTLQDLIHRTTPV